MSFFSDEKAKLEGDAKSAYSWASANWKRLVGYYAAYYVSTHWGPAASAKAQSILKIFGF